MNGVVRLDGGFGLDITCCGLLLEISGFGLDITCCGLLLEIHVDLEKTLHVVGCYLKFVWIWIRHYMLWVVT